jgi:hypothetical protein
MIARHNIRLTFRLLVLIGGVGTAIFFGLAGDFMRAMIGGTVAFAALCLVTLDKCP